MDDVVASEGDALRLIQMMGNYLVALVARFTVCDTNGTPIGMEILPISGFTTHIGKRRFWVTAGHCLRDSLDKKLTDSTYKLESMSFMDCFGERQTRIAALPMEYQSGDGWAVHEPDSAIDFAVLPITDGEWDAMKQNGIQTINPATWKDLPEQSFEYKVVGFPGERVVRMEELDTWGLRPTAVSVQRLRPEDVGYGSPDWFAGELKVDASQVKSVQGMSGGPIFAFWKDEEKRIFCHVIAVQSWWQPFERLIFGCKMGFFFECMRRRFAEKPSADASANLYSPCLGGCRFRD